MSCDPRPFTLRELCLMIDASVRERWNRTSHILAAILNSQVGRKTPVDPRRLTPFDRSETDETAGVSLTGVLGIEMEDFEL